MKHKGIRIALVVIEAFIGLSAIGGGIAILTDAFDQWLPVTWLQGTPFSNYTIPGLLVRPWSGDLRTRMLPLDGRVSRASLPNQTC